MINLKVLSTVAALALILVPSASFAQNAHVRGGGGGRPAGVAGHPGGGGHPGGAFHPGGGGGPRFSGGGGGYHGGYHGGGRGGGFIPGAVAGAVVGGAIAAGAGGYGYYGPGYDQGYYGGDQYSDQYYDDSGAMAEAPAPAGDDAVSYCVQRFRSYDPQSGTYMGNDGYRHPCP
jgi:hypothetical protein